MKSGATKIFRGALADLPTLVEHHLFVICPNNSGSTFLRNALATSRATWNLPREGQHTFGFAGPSSRALGAATIWATRPQWVAAFQNPANFDWVTTRRAWYFQAFSRSAGATVFVEKSPPFLLLVDQLVDSFSDARFLFMVRDPYATAEGISRRLCLAGYERQERLALAALHLALCLEAQAENLRRYGHLGTFFSYEDMCDRPQQVQAQIAGLMPQLADLDLRQQLPVKGSYDEPLRNMNEQQWGRLSGEDLATLNRVYGECEALLANFGYRLRG
ncbi:MAG: sulfotransferase [Vulcanimicrobiota bacterium]